MLSNFTNVPVTQETAETIKTFVADQVAYYKQLQSIVSTDEIPKKFSRKDSS